MRSLALIFPILVLGSLFLWLPRDGGEAELASSEPESKHHAPNIVWISHDWVEVVPSEESKMRAEARRRTFGLDAARAEDAECFDPNCRACLIDLVYGREF